MGEKPEKFQRRHEAFGYIKTLDGKLCSYSLLLLVRKSAINDY
jgi:hypothetical protein